MGSKNKERINIDLNSKSSQSVPGRGQSASRGRASARDFISKHLKSSIEAADSVAADTGKVSMKAISKTAGRKYKGKPSVASKGNSKGNSISSSKPEQTRSQYLSGLISDYKGMVDKRQTSSNQGVSGGSGSTNTPGGAKPGSNIGTPIKDVASAKPIKDAKKENGKGTNTITDALNIIKNIAKKG